MTQPIVPRETISESTSADAPRPLTIAIISGGITYERDISLRSAHHLATTLRKLGYSAHNLHPNQDLIAQLQEIKPDLVWPVMHGGIGEDGSLQSLLELLKIPFIGSSSDSARLASSKPTAKALVSAKDVPTPESITLPRSLFTQFGAAALVDLVSESMQFPLVVKPVDGGSSLGVSTVDSVDSLRSALVEAFSYSDSALLEKFVAGREIAISFVDFEGGRVLLPAVEIATESGAYDFEARYSSGRSVFYTPARLTESEVAACQKTASDVANILGMRDIARIDLLLDDAGTAWFIEANVSPGLTDMSLFPQAARAYDSLPEVVDGLIRAKLA